MHYLITGHTGFKGAWLTVLLKERGHEVSGISLAADTKSIYSKAKLGNDYKFDFTCDIRDQNEVKNLVKTISPDVVIHLAAQALVLESYKNPIFTYETNVLGTLNVLEATRGINSIKAALIITTDKVYKNIGKLSGYVESDALGGSDPYSASKAAADIATQSWIASFADFPIAIARAGNVIGAGDWSADRLLPDLLTAYFDGKTPTLRNPGSIRPWQHVLDCLSGYLTLIQHQLHDGFAGEWNFGPKIEPDKTVEKVVQIVESMVCPGAGWNLSTSANPHEAPYLLLDSAKARNRLGWSEKLNFENTLQWSINGYLDIANGRSSRETIESQVRDFLSK